MRALPPGAGAFWQDFEAASGREQLSRFYETFPFAGSEATADNLAALALQGTKRATAGLVGSFEAAGHPLVEPGDPSVVTNWAGEPLCVIEATAVEVVPFARVGATFAAIEGEGDGSLETWRDAHWACFGRECAPLGRVPSASMPVASERFDVVHRRVSS